MAGRFSSRSGAPPGGIWVCLLPLMTLASACASQMTEFSPGVDLDRAEMMHRVRVLSAPELAGRGNGTQAALAAADSIALWFGLAGLQPGAGADGWFQDFVLQGDGLAGKTARNVVGMQSGRGRLTGRWVVVGAHYDHLGRADSVFTDFDVPEPGAYYPGADDNASGVTILVELAQLACRSVGDSEPDGTEPPLRSCLFVSFAGEEVGIQGSAYLVKHLPVPRDSIDVMINLDSVGRLRERRLFVAGVGTAADLPRLVRNANRDSLQLELSQGGWDASDHVSFNTIEVPVLFLFTGAQPDYHLPTDTWQHIDAANLVRVAGYTWRLLTDLRSLPVALAYQDVGEISSRPEPPGTRPERKAWLGAIPDFTEQVQGVMLAGVIADSPAESVGLIKGDILMGVAGEPVHDLADFAQILRSCEPGQQVRVLISREGRQLTFDVILADRADR